MRLRSLDVRDRARGRADRLVPPRAFRRHRGFHVVVADVHEPRRNPAGASLPGEYRFPYAGRTFDVVLLSQALGHLLPEAAEHQLAESARVLRAGGRLVATSFALSDTSRFLMAEGKSGLVFEDAEEPVAVLDETRPEEAVACDEEWLFERLREHGLALDPDAPGIVVRERGTHGFPGSAGGGAG